VSEVFGYARVSTDGQELSLQIDALRLFGCTQIIKEKASGAAKSRPKFDQLLKQIKHGDTLVVWKLDRIGRSLTSLLQIIECLQKIGAHFKCVDSPIDTSSASGTLMLQILGSVAEFERSLVVERTLAGLRAAKARGRIGGNPRIRSRDPDALRELQSARKVKFKEDVRSRMSTWLPVVRRERPETPWTTVLKFVNASVPARQKFTIEKLLRHVRAAVQEGLVEPSVLERSRSRLGPGGLLENDPSLKIIAVALKNDPKRKLKDLATDLRTARIKTSRGNVHWSSSSVANLVKRAKLLRY
jgi:DNA invertase Pin-like site-specific DNA recombinase